MYVDMYICSLNVGIYVCTCIYMKFLPLYKQMCVQQVLEAICHLFKYKYVHVYIRLIQI